MDRNVCPCPARQIAKVAEIFQFSRLLPRPSAASRLLKYLATRVGRARPRQARAFRREPERRAPAGCGRRAEPCPARRRAKGSGPKGTLVKEAARAGRDSSAGLEGHNGEAPVTSQGDPDRDAPRSGFRIARPPLRGASCSSAGNGARISRRTCAGGSVTAGDGMRKIVWSALVAALLP